MGERKTEELKKDISGGGSRCRGRKVKGDIQHWGVPHLARKVKTIG